MPVPWNNEPEKSQQKESDPSSSSSSTTSSSAFSEQSIQSSTTSTSYSSDGSASNGDNAIGEPLSREEADRLYEERMEEEYAKREGGQPLLAKPENGPLLSSNGNANGNGNKSSMSDSHDRNYEIDTEAQDWAPYRTFQPSPSPSRTLSSTESTSSSRINPRIVSDAILGLSDGLTVPFALSAGLSALGNTKVVVMGSLAELVAGAISMGLGGYVGAKSEVESYRTIQRETKDLVNASPEETMALVREVFAPYKLPEEPVVQMSNIIHDSPGRLMEFLMTFHHKQAEPDCNQAWISAITLALGYFIGGFIPLVPYFCVSKVQIALYYSIGVMAITLLVFGYIKTCIVRGWRGADNVVAGIKGGIQMCLVGGIAAGAAIALVRAIDHAGHGW